MAALAFNRLLSGIDYDPLLASWPDTRFDQRLLDESPAVARFVLKQAYRHTLEGYNAPADVWDEWLALLESFGPDHEGVQIALMGLIFLPHEMRHDLDFYATPLGWFFLQCVAGEYDLLRQLHDVSSTSGRTHILARLRRHVDKYRDLLGTISVFRPSDYSPAPSAERALPDGILRVRESLNDSRRAILTIQPRDSIERALSTSAVLECRAVLETAGHAADKLTAAGADAASVGSSLELLLRLGVDPHRDDYWALLTSALPAKSLSEASWLLARGSERKVRLMLATWFGLHVQHPTLTEPDLLWAPAFRASFALKKLADLTEEQWQNPKTDWESVLAQVGAMLGDPPLADSIGRWGQSCKSLEDLLAAGAFGDGLGSRHVAWLLSRVQSGLDLRVSEERWLGSTGWPPQEDPRTVALGADPPADVRTAWSRLTRLHQSLRANAGESAIADLASSLFSNKIEAEA